MGDKRILSFDYNAGTTQAPVFLEDFEGIYRGVQLAPIVTGAGYLQSTLSSREEIEDNEANWVNWPSGSISSVTQDTIDPTVTAIRVYRTSGALRLNVRIV
jgi:hypothetical protein